MQIAQTPQERMERGFQRGAGIALARFLGVAALQIGAGAERAPRTGQDQATDLGPFVIDRVERLTEAAEHVERDRVHHFGMVEFEDRDRPIEIERDVLELHLFPRAFWPSLFVPRCEGFNLQVPYLIFRAALSMVGFVILPSDARPDGNGPRKRPMSIFDLTGRVAV